MEGTTSTGQAGEVTDAVEHGVLGPPGRRRNLVIVGAAVVVLAAAVAGGAVLTGDDGSAVVRQTLCGFPRAAGTPLNSLMPKGRAGVEEWRTKTNEDGSPGLRSCWISVDGEEGLAVQLMAVGADEPTDVPSGKASTPRELAGRGIVPTRGTAAGMVLCPAAPDRVAVISVMLHPAMYLEKPDEAAVAEQTRLLGVLAEQVKAERLAEVCG
ncbi:hypothetical protein [Kitasatospora purpeofusca]|uniref:hypothetical protein n=1 Tax=Kitasatospora purpeofusca TaxID=67352 RepID=UPI00386A2A28|nr:hypothetical protein OIP63_29045 [Kitasatospora purpeofusca]